MALEIAAGRMIAPYVGMSLYSWMAVTVVMLSGLTFGHWIGGRLIDAPRINPSKALAVALGLAAVLSLAAIPLLRSVSGVVLARCGPVWGAFAITTLVCFLPSLLAAV